MFNSHYEAIRCILQIECLNLYKPLKKGVVPWKYLKRQSTASITMPKIPKKNTAVNYQVFLARFNEQFGERELHTHYLRRNTYLFDPT